jgi:hypothetical protein
MGRFKAGMARRGRSTAVIVLAVVGIWLPVRGNLA